MPKISGQFALDRSAIKGRMAKAERQFHRSAGAYVRKVARNSIPVRKKRLTKAQRSARVGKPPTSSGRFKSSILFDFDTVTAKTVVGPTGDHKNPSPAAFEKGGAFPFFAPAKGDLPAATLTGQFRKFPTMAPALKASASKLPTFWKL